MANLIRLRDFRFLLFDVFECAELPEPRYGDHDQDMLLAMLEMAQTVAQNEFEPLQLSSTRPRQN